jgi:hypothetical protein
MTHQIHQDTLTVPVVLPDTVRVSPSAVVAPRPSLSDLDSVMIRMEQREKEIRLQVTRRAPVRPPEREVVPEPAVPISHVEAWQKPLEWIAFPPKEKNSSPLEVYPTPILMNDNWKEFRFHGLDYKAFSSSENSSIRVQQRDLFIPDWFSHVLLFSFLLLTILKMAFSRFLSPLLSALFSHRETSNLYHNKNSITQNSFVLLQFLFLINAAVFLYLCGSWFGIWPDVPGLYIFLVLGAGLFLLYQIKFFLLYLTGFFFDRVKAFSDYIHSISLFNKILGLAFLPLSAGIVFLGDPLVPIFIYLGLSLLVVLYLVRLMRGSAIILENGFSVFYLFLYLCALEIMPLLIVYKLLKTEL